MCSSDSVRACKTAYLFTVQKQMIKQATIRGRRWRVVDSAPMKIPELGYCTNPDLDRELAIPVHGDTMEELDVIIHEIIHACFFDMSEEAVDESASSIATVLWKLGWRNEN